MTTCKKYIEHLEMILPTMCDIQDLIKHGIVRHRNSMAKYRTQGIAPPHIRTSERRFLYPREGLIEWLKKRDHDTQMEAKK